MNWASCRPNSVLLFGGARLAIQPRSGIWPVPLHQQSWPRCRFAPSASPPGRGGTLPSRGPSHALPTQLLGNTFFVLSKPLYHAHRALDEAVAEAYGWGDDFRAGLLSDDEVLARLFVLNQERAAS